MSEQNNNAITLKITRDRKSLLKRTPAVILVQSKLVSFYPGQSQLYHFEPGYYTMTINKRRHFSFYAEAGDEKEFVICEGIKDWRFLLKYSLRFMFVIILFLIGGQTSNQYAFGPALFFGVLLLAYVIKDIKYDLFYIEEHHFVFENTESIQ